MNEEHPLSKDFLLKSEVVQYLFHAPNKLQLAHLIYPHRLVWDSYHDAWWRTLFQYACEHEEFEIARILRDRGADINHGTRDGVTALHLYTYKPKVVDFLLTFPEINLNKRDFWLRTPLEVMVRGNEDKRTIMKLMQHGASLRVKDSRGKTLGENIQSNNKEYEWLLGIEVTLILMQSYLPRQGGSAIRKAGIPVDLIRSLHVFLYSLN